MKGLQNFLDIYLMGISVEVFYTVSILLGAGIIGFAYHKNQTSNNTNIGTGNQFNSAGEGNQNSNTGNGNQFNINIDK